MSLETIKRKMAYLNMQHTPGILAELAERAVKKQAFQPDFLDRVLILEVENPKEFRMATWPGLSGLPKGMHLDNFDFMFQPTVEEIDFLATGEFIRHPDRGCVSGQRGSPRRVDSVDRLYPIAIGREKGR